jgi:hypothetical protein
VVSSEFTRCQVSYLLYDAALCSPEADRALFGINYTDVQKKPRPYPDELEEMFKNLPPEEGRVSPSFVTTSLYLLVS